MRKNYFLVVVGFLLTGIIKVDAQVTVASNNGNDSIYVGTNNDFDVVFKRKNIFSGYLNKKNTSFGVNSGSAYQSVFIGSNSGTNHQGLGENINNVFVGFNSGSINKEGYSNTFLGTFTGKNNVEGNKNVFIGTSSGLNNVDGYKNVFIGVNSGKNSVDGYDNVFVGRDAGLENIGGYHNVFVGANSGSVNTTGIQNTYIGLSSGKYTNGSGNSFMGNASGSTVLSGNYNTLIGYNSGYGLINGNNNTIIGSGNGLAPNLMGTIVLADTHPTNPKQRVYIHNNGNVGIGLGNNVIPKNKLDIHGGVAIGTTYGAGFGTSPFVGTVAPTNGLIVEGRVGIGTTLPTNKLEITHGTDGNSGLRFTNLTSNYNPLSTQTTNKFLSVNATGDVVLSYLPNDLNSNSLASNQNVMNSNVSGITSSTTIINSISNTINSSNQLVTNVNGVASAPVDIPVPYFTDTDAQTLSLTGNTLAIANGNSVTLPTTNVIAGTNVTVTGNGTAATPFQISSADADAQSLSLTGNNLSISNGNTVVLPTFVEVDGSVTNELQTLSQAGNVVTLSNNGGSFTLPTFTDTDDQTLTLTGNTLAIANGNSVTLPTTNVIAGTNVTVTGNGSAATPFQISSVNTDQQSLSLTGNNLSISNGNTVVLPTFVEVDGSVTNELQTLSQTGNVVTLSNNGGSFTLPTFTDTDDQTLTLTGNTLAIANGNSVTLPTTNVIAGTNVTVTGNGSAATPFQISSVNTDAQTLSLTGNTLAIANGNSVTLPTTNVIAGTNVTVTGNGSAATPFVVNSSDTSLYANNGSINTATTIANNRVVDMNNRNIWFNTSTSPNHGKIYIGNTATYPNTSGYYKLFVEGGILTEKVKVSLRNSANWADYVFDENYNLLALDKLEQYIATNKHLPGIDSASELVNNGLDLSEMQAKQMAKIEELTLYIIDQNKALVNQKSAIEKQNAEIEELKLQVKALIEKTK